MAVGGEQRPANVTISARVNATKLFADVRFWPKPAPGVEWRVAGIPPKAAAELE